MHLEPLNKLRSPSGSIGAPTVSCSSTKLVPERVGSHLKEKENMALNSCEYGRPQAPISVVSGLRRSTFGFFFFHQLQLSRWHITRSAIRSFDFGMTNVRYDHSPCTQLLQLTATTEQGGFWLPCSLYMCQCIAKKANPVVMPSPSQKRGSSHNPLRRHGFPGAVSSLVYLLRNSVSSA